MSIKRTNYLGIPIELTKNKWNVPTSNGVPLEKVFDGEYREYIYYISKGKYGIPIRASELIKEIYKSKVNKHEN